MSGDATGRRSIRGANLAKGCYNYYVLRKARMADAARILMSETPTFKIPPIVEIVNGAADDGEWAARIVELREFRRLADGWDGESAIAPSTELVDGALALAQILRDQHEPAPDRVVAGVNGTISFEWHTPLGYREIEVDSPNSGAHRWVERGSKVCVVSDLHWDERTARLGSDLRQVAM